MIVQRSVEVEVHPEPWAGNPYAWDFPESDGKFRPENHIGIPLVKALVDTLYTTSGICGGIFSFTLLYLVLKHSTGPLKNYSRMLLLCCSSDIGFWFCDSIVQVRSKLTDGVFMFTLEGPIKHFSYELQVHAMCWYVCHLTLMHTIIPAQYYYRYYTVSNPHHMNKTQTFGLYLIALVGAFPMYWITYKAYRYSGLARPGFNYALLWYDEQPLPALIIGDVNDFIMKLYFIASIVIVGGCYVLTLVLALITLKKLDTNNKKYSQRTRDMQAQLTKALMFQTILPVFTSVSPILCICVPCFLYVSTGPSASILLAIVSWVPVFNPLLTIWIIIPYRRVVFSCILRTKVEASATSDVSEHNKLESQSRDNRVASVNENIIF
ncbi:unnamed protein product [Bursaphelenchus xylophilus]|uniref:(pine wood nematode) hypothetical protein n=1 Tax=Bursaphelenchus xylophilus TaxID=6326 RepID=A0A1I7S5Z7_BURXY|nr:unnamed protein product [Bursaphelenchus xylophilus]CAG9082462.1 unnamed protein product [Bursaphelenchus xylophilus]